VLTVIPLQPQPEEETLPTSRANARSLAAQAEDETIVVFMDLIWAVTSVRLQAHVERQIGCSLRQRCELNQG
jgi:hypothetical protein